MLNNLKELCLLDGVSGNEGKVAEYIVNEIASYAECYIDPLGNVIAHKKGTSTAKKRVLFDAHMDEVGLIITGIKDNGMLTFSCVGGINTEVLLAKRVKIGDIYGVICVKPIHMLSDDEKKKLPDKDSLLIDIGALSKDEAEKYVEIGDVAVFDSDYIEFGDNKIKAKAIDDRLGCAILIDIIKSDLPFDAWFSFTVQEEVGLRGAKTASFSVDPDFAIAIEATTACDIIDTPENKSVCKLNEGAVVSFMDGSTLYEKQLFNAAISTANNIGKKIQVKRGTSGGNNAGAIHLAKSGVRTVSLSIPCRYLHSPECVIDKRDIESVRDIAVGLFEQMADDKI